MEIDPFSMLEVSLTEPEADDQECLQFNNSLGFMPSPVPSEGSVSQFVMQPEVAVPSSPNAINRVLLNHQKLSSTTRDEDRYRRRFYSNINVVLKQWLHCTICGIHIGAHLGLRGQSLEHPLLKVLTCPECTTRYKPCDFPLTPEGKDRRCRWCTTPSSATEILRHCNKCPFAFCEKCILRNMKGNDIARKTKFWSCMVCRLSSLWPARSLLWALRVLIQTNFALKEQKKWELDQSSCCGPKSQPLLIQYSPTPSLLQTTLLNPKPSYAGRSKSTPVMKQLQPVVHAVPNQGLFETQWLVDKIKNVKKSLGGFNTKLDDMSHAFAPYDQKFSIKSKLISLVSLINMTAAQLKLVARQIEDQGKKLLDNHLGVLQPKASTLSDYRNNLNNNVSNNNNRNTKRSRKSKSSGPSSKRKKIDPVVEPEIIELDDEDEEIIHINHSPLPFDLSEVKPCFVRLERLEKDVLEKFECPKRNGTLRRGSWATSTWDSLDIIDVDDNVSDTEPLEVDLDEPPTVIQDSPIGIDQMDDEPSQTEPSNDQSEEKTPSVRSSQESEETVEKEMVQNVIEERETDDLTSPATGKLISEELRENESTTMETNNEPSQEGTKEIKSECSETQERETEDDCSQENEIQDEVTSESDETLNTRTGENVTPESDETLNTKTGENVTPDSDETSHTKTGGNVTPDSDETSHTKTGENVTPESGSQENEQQEESETPEKQQESNETQQSDSSQSVSSAAESGTNGAPENLFGQISNETPENIGERNESDLTNERNEENHVNSSSNIENVLNYLDYTTNEIINAEKTAVSNDNIISGSNFVAGYRKDDDDSDDDGSYLKTSDSSSSSSSSSTSSSSSDSTDDN